MKRDGKIGILVVDDHFTVRMGLIALINTELDMLIPAIRAVAAGLRWIPNEIAEQLASRNCLNNGPLTKSFILK
jgi:DNA-binding NarL/FixJ family response regulator